MKVLVLGGASYDDIIHVDEFFEPVAKTIFTSSSYSMAGSTGVGKALAMKKLGFDVDFHAVIGKDIYGEMITRELIEQGVRFFPHYTEETERHTNIMNKHGERISIFKSFAGNPVIDVSIYEDLIEKADIVVLNIIDYCRKFIPLLRKHKKPIYCDLHDYDIGNPHHQDFIDCADYLLLSSEKMPDYENFMSQMIDQGKRWIVVTHGSLGSSAMDKTHKLFELSGSKIEIIDTNGAGDNFFAGFVYGMEKGNRILEALELGRISADACIQSEKITSDELNPDFLQKKMSESIKN